MKTLDQAVKAADKKIEDDSWLPYTQRIFKICFRRRTSQGETYFWAEEIEKGSEIGGGLKTPCGITEEDALKVGTKVYRITSLIERIK